MKSRRPLHLKTILMILIMVIAGPLGNVLLAKGMKQVGKVAFWPPSGLLHVTLRVFRSTSVWLGVASLLTFFVANMMVLTWADYSYVLPAGSVAYAVIALLAYFMLGERVTLLHWIGIAIICVGVFTVGRTSPRTVDR
jgi:drug/metabolite transporter (DMT)-like permease